MIELTTVTHTNFDYVLLLCVIIMCYYYTHTHIYTLNICIHFYILYILYILNIKIYLLYIIYNIYYKYKYVYIYLLEWASMTSLQSGVFWCFQVLDLSFLPLAFSIILTMASGLLHPFSTDSKTSRFVLKQFSTAKNTQRGSQNYMEKRRQEKREEGDRGDWEEKNGSQKWRE